MGMSTKQIQNDLMDALKASEPKTSAYDTEAEVVRIEGSVAWVHISGGVDETPVAMTISAEPGDTVRVRVSGGTAWLMGNDTAPPTDDKKAIAAQQMAAQAVTSASEAIKNVDVLDRSLTQEEIFNRLTADNTTNGIYIDPVTGRIYIDATYIESGAFRILDDNGNVIFLADKDSQTFVWNTDYCTLGSDGKLVLKDRGKTWDSDAASFRVESAGSPYVEIKSYKILAGSAEGITTVTDNEIAMKTVSGAAGDVFSVGFDYDENLNVYSYMTLGGAPTIKKVSASCTYTIPAGGSHDITLTELGLTKPANYVCIGVPRLTTGNSAVVVRSYNFNGAASVVASLVNTSSAAVTATFAVDLAYAYFGMTDTF